MKPKVDFAFKEIMMDEKARVGFLSAILKLDPAQVRETRILNTYLQKVHEDDKQGILDVQSTAPCSILPRCTRNRLSPGSFTMCLKNA